MNSPRSPERSERLKAIAFMCGAATVFSVLDTLAKYLAVRAGLPVTEVIWVRFASNVVLNMFMFGPLLFTALARSSLWRTHVLRSLFMAGTTGLNFFALRYLRLDQTVTIFFIAPFIVALLAGPILNEWIGWRRLLAVFAGFTGVLFVTRPGFGGVHPAVVLSLGASLSYALYAISTRYLTRREPAELAQQSMPLAGFLLFMPFAIADWVWPADMLTAFGLIIMGFIGGFGHWLLVLAHRHAPAPIIAPFTYIGLPSMAALGFVIFGDVPDWWTLFGALIIISAGIYLIWRENS